MASTNYRKMYHRYSQYEIVKCYKKLSKFHKTKTYADVTIQCEGQSFRCHRLVLSMASDFFDSLFERCRSKNAHEMSVVVLLEMDADVFEHVLDFIYTGGIKITPSNICRLLKASNYLALTSMADLCAKFVAETNRMTIESVFEIFNFAHETKSKTLIQAVDRRIADHLLILHKTNHFLELPFDALITILDAYSKSSKRNEELLLGAICRWIRHSREERATHTDTLMATVRLEYVSAPYMHFVMSRLVATDDNNNCLTVHDTASELGDEIDDESALHVYVRYDYENMMRVFWVNDAGKCALAKNDVPILNPVECLQRVATRDDTYMYCFARESPLTQQSFVAYSSVDMSSPIKLMPPPLVFGSALLTTLQNNIYVYTDYLEKVSDFMQINSSSAAAFNDHELKRGIYAYNCGVDKWYPVPPTKRHLKRSCLTSCHNTLYLIGGCDDVRAVPGGYAQFYDFRLKEWLELPRTKQPYCYASCCALNDQIYVCGGTVNCFYGKHAERYDPIAGKWEEIAHMNAERALHRVVPYSNKLWVLGSCDTRTNVLENNDLTVEIFDPKLNQWSVSTVLAEAAMKTHNPTTIFDGVVFKSL